ncbi:MAG: hypothetical protein AAF487_00840 [Bacteroidota bacterium]
MSVKKKSKAIEKIITGLYSANHDEIMKSLKQIPSKGTHEVILPLLDLYNASSSIEVKQKISEIILQLKDEDCIEPLLDALKDKKYAEIKNFIISAFWNNNFDMGNHLNVLTKCAVEGDYLTALEALTVIENQDGPFDDEMLMDAIVTSREYISENKENEKTQLILSLNRVLENFELNQ